MPDNPSTTYPAGTLRTITLDADLHDQLHNTAILAGIPPGDALKQAIALYLEIARAGPGRVMRPLTIGPFVKAVIVRNLPNRHSTPAWVPAAVVAAVALFFVLAPVLLVLLRT